MANKILFFQSFRKLTLLLTVLHKAHTAVFSSVRGDFAVFLTKFQRRTLLRRCWNLKVVLILLDRGAIYRCVVRFMVPSAWQTIARMWERVGRGTEIPPLCRPS